MGLRSYQDTLFGSLSTSRLKFPQILKTEFHNVQTQNQANKEATISTKKSKTNYISNITVGEAIMCYIQREHKANQIMFENSDAVQPQRCTKSPSKAETTNNAT